jgi:hypothetical protein
VAHAYDKYLKKRAELDRWRLVSGSLDGIAQVVVIPVLAEHGFLFHTLESLGTNPTSELKRTLVVCVVNNRRPSLAPPGDIEENHRILELLDAAIHGRRLLQNASPGASSLRLAYVDASSPGLELPEKGGVGLARKIGMDWAVSIFSGSKRSHDAVSVLVSLDADTLVEPNYLRAIRSHFDNTGAWAAVISYAHQTGGSQSERAAIVCYEIFLRYHVLGLHYAGSPYAFHTIGSTIACSADAYVAVSGMNRRQAGEDFYFLQQLAKTGAVDQISDTTVHPSARASSRTPFGTGRRVSSFPDRREQAYLAYHPESYAILKRWLDVVKAGLADDAGQLLAGARGIHPELARFLNDQGFSRAWCQLQENSSDNDALHGQFHRWFDGLRTLKLIHHLRDHGYPEQNVLDSIEWLLQAAGLAWDGSIGADRIDDVDSQLSLLQHLQKLPESDRFLNADRRWSWRGPCLPDHSR